ncbi:MAG: histidine kinase [Bacteroidota bacterium]
MFNEWLTAKRYRWWRHLVFWVLLHIVFAWTYYLRGYLHRFWYDAALLTPFDLCAAYLSAYWLVPRFLLRRRYVTFGIGFVSILLVFAIITRVIQVYLIYPEYFPKGYNGRFWDMGNIINYSIASYALVFLFIGVQLFKRWFSNERQRQELVQQNLKSELALLRSQINPHFLFNTLNNIDTLIFKNPVAASESIEQLSSIMRYMLYETNTEIVTVKKELAYLEGMISLIRLRMKEPDAIDFKYSGCSIDKFLPPMLLVPLVENAYKHGLKKGDSPLIRIRLDMESEHCVFFVENLIPELAIRRKDDVGGIGLVNVRRRLDLIFPKRYQLRISNNKNVFTVKLRFPWLPTPEPAEDSQREVFVEKDSV